jgi:glycosyltransferase involved in cell wall biosynthesis
MDLRPKVSICVPNLNTRPYLPERFESIFKQTFQDWELIVVDNYSDDEAWEYIKTLAANKPRMRISQAAREGMYANWNNCIKLARGEYVYIATSDDTMSPDFLEKMVEALERHPECDLAHCALKAIDEHGCDRGNWWFTSSVFARSAPEMVRCRHVRKAPLDGLLHLGAISVYVSITQLLIRRRLFEKVGVFEGRWGSLSDFNWNMRATLAANTIHIPDTWGGWRIHLRQATARIDEATPEHRHLKDEMIEHAMDSGGVLLPKVIQGEWWRLLRKYLCKKEEIKRGVCSHKPIHARATYLLSESLKGSQIPLEYVHWRFTRNGHWREEPALTIRRWLKEKGLNDMLIPAEK